MFVRGKGTELWDIDGKRYLDFLCGLAVTSLGHANPAVAEAISTQAHELLHVSNLFANPVAVAGGGRRQRAARRGDRVRRAGLLHATRAPRPIECAIKLARKHGGRGRHVVVSALGSFHGRTLAALAATGQPTKHEPFQPMPEGFRHVAWGDLDALDRAVDATVGAVLIEPIRVRAGSTRRQPGTSPASARLCDGTGA